jgi:hypothetical protein
MEWGTERCAISSASCGFIAGDDWTIALRVVLTLGTAALLARGGIPTWWLLPGAVVLLLAASVWRVARTPR